ncbi:hypothetical protein [Aquisphaera insulae]|uniref:hypothetical protein n=1 Tax=Aquisphaera insulae TaxID=2712864 RepID=UPI0013EB8509|nr:hypothetical protein [Aquisphaera insulae]
MPRPDGELSRRSLLLRLPAAALTTAAMTSASAQPPASSLSGSSRAGVPRLPGAVTKPPDWLGAGAPFDVAAYFKAPPDDQNAAPLYLDALFEFGSNVAVCFPEGPPRARREQSVKERTKRYAQIYEMYERDPNAISAREMNAFLATYDEGLAKLERAQQRPRCVFQTGIGVNSLLPHVQDARPAGRVLLWKARRLMEQGNLAGALQQTSRLLRLTRDLRPRAVMITALIALALERMAIKEAFLPLLATRGLKVEHCDALLAMLREHDAKSIDVDSEVLRGEYLVHRSTLRDLVLHQDQLRRDLIAMGIQPGPSLVVSLLTGQGQGKSIAGDRGPEKVPDIDARMAKLTPAELGRQEAMLADYYRRLLGLAGTPYADRLRRVMEPPPESRSADLITRVTMSLVPAMDGIAWSAFVQAGLRNVQGLAAVRRSQIRNGGKMPASLEAATREAGFPKPPVDPYTGGPIRWNVIEGRPVVYCVGADGKDDQGRTEAERPGKGGDVLLRLPEPK